MPEARMKDAARNPYVRLLALLAGIFLFGWIVYGLRAVLTPVLLSLLIAYILDPVVDWFERRRVNRTAAILILLLGLFVGTGVMLVLIGLAVRDFKEVAERLPGWLEDVVLPWLRGPATAWVSSTFELDLDFEGLLDELRRRLTELAPRLAGPAQTILASALSGTLALAAWLANIILIPLFSFYLLRDFDRITAAVRDLIPPAVRERAVRVFAEIDVTIAAFVRGQLTVMLILGVLYAIGLAAFRVQGGIGIGLLAGLLSVIPYLGFVVGIGLAILMSLMGGEQLWLNLIGVGVTFGVVQTLESTVITPKVVGEKVGLHPVWVIVALMVGAHALGVLGMLLALPVAAIVKILLKYARARYEASELYDRGSIAPPAAPEEAAPAEEEPPAEAVAEEPAEAGPVEREEAAPAEETPPPAEPEDTVAAEAGAGAEPEEEARGEEPEPGEDDEPDR